MDLYIGNATKQHHLFCYQVIENSNNVANRQQNIPVGGQIRLTGLNTPQIDAIVGHHQRYGMMSVEEAAAKTIRNREVIGLVYSVDKPIAVPRLTMVIERNTAVLKEQGKKNRQDAAVAVAAGLERALEENRELNADLAEVDVEVIQDEDRGGGYAQDNPVGERFKVTRDPNAENGRPSRGGRGRR